MTTSINIHEAKVSVVSSMNCSSGTRSVTMKLSDDVEVSLFFKNRQHAMDLEEAFAVLATLEKRRTKEANLGSYLPRRNIPLTENAE